MSAAFVSTSYLGTAMLPTVARAQSSLTNLEVESSTGQYADLGLQLGGQSGYELSLKNENDLLQTLTSGNDHRHDESDDRAGRSQFDSLQRPERGDEPDRVELDGSQRGRDAAEPRRQRAASR